MLKRCVTSHERTPSYAYDTLSLIVMSAWRASLTALSSRVWERRQQRSKLGAGERAAPLASAAVGYRTVAIVGILLLYLLQFEDSLLRIAARSVILTLPKFGSSSSLWVSDGALRLAESPETDWENEPGKTAEEQEAEEENEEAETEAAVAAVVQEENEEHCFTTVLALPSDSKRRTVAEALRHACECTASGQASPSSFVIPLLWWGSARMNAYSLWANGPRQYLDGEFRWDYGHILERPIESYPDVFDARPSLAWDAGMLFTPSYFLSGRFIVNLTTAEACGVILQPTSPVMTQDDSTRLWFERFAIAGIRQHYPRSSVAIDGDEAAEPGGGGKVSLKALYSRNIAVAAVLTGQESPSPFYAEAMQRAKEFSVRDSLVNGANGGQGLLPFILGSDGQQWVAPLALELGMKAMSNDLAVGVHTGARVHIHRPLSPIIVPRFYPDIFREMNLVRLMVMPPNSTAIRDWAFVPGVVHNVTQYVVTYCGVFFRKLETAVIRLNRPGGDAQDAIEAAKKAVEIEELNSGDVDTDLEGQRLQLEGDGAGDGAGSGSSGGGGGGLALGVTSAVGKAMRALMKASSPSPSRMPAPDSPQYGGWLEERTITGVSVKSCKIMPTPSASRPPSPSPVAKADFALAMKVDEYLPIMHRWHSNVYHLYGETVTRALSVYPFVDHSRGYIAGDDGLVRGLRMLGRWRVRDLTIDRDTPVLVSAKALHLVDPMLCQMTSANELLLLREALRAALKLPAPPLGYLRAPIARDPDIISTRLVRAASPANLAQPFSITQHKYGCPAYLYRRPRILVIRRRATRLLSNYHTLLNSLKSSGAIITIFDELALPPPLETFGLFARSDVIIGVHGAGLTNVIASSPGAAVFEILPSSFPGLHYAEYSIVMGLEYHRWEVPGEEPPHAPSSADDTDGSARRNRTHTKDKDAHVTAPVGEIMTSLCAYVTRRFGVTADDWAAAGLSDVAAAATAAAAGVTASEAVPARRAHAAAVAAAPAGGTMGSGSIISRQRQAGAGAGAAAAAAARVPVARRRSSRASDASADDAASTSGGISPGSSREGRSSRWIGLGLSSRLRVGRYNGAGDGGSRRRKASAKAAAEADAAAPISRSRSSGSGHSGSSRALTRRGHLERRRRRGD